MLGLGIGINRGSKGRGLQKPYDYLPSLMCWYELNDIGASNTALKDFIVSGTVTNPVGLVGNCLDCGGTGGYSRTDGSKDFMPEHGTNKTICGWFKINAVDANFTIFQSYSEDTLIIIRLHYDTETGKVKFTAGNTTITFDDTFETSDWNFFAIRYNGTTDTFRVSIKSIYNVQTFVEVPVSANIPHAVDLGYDITNSYANVSLDSLGVWEYEQSDVGLTWLFNYGLGRAYSEL